MSKNDTHVRRFKEEDIPWLVDTCIEEIPKLPNYVGISVDTDKVKFLLGNAVKDESAFTVFVLCDSHNEKVGGLAAFCGPVIFSKDVQTSDVFTFVYPHWRTFHNWLKLVRTYKEWAMRRNAAIIRLGHSSGYRSAEMDLLLAKEGFQKSGSTYRFRR